MPPSNHPSERLEWLSLMRGLSIVLVVMFHVQLVDMATGENHSLCTTLPTIFTPIRMPFFIFTSGGLLYLSRIRREWTTRALYADKLRRIAIPFVFFVTFYYLFNPNRSLEKVSCHFLMTAIRKIALYMLDS